jgi:putative membrane-bound dehydrogenase-like protein
MDDYSMDRFGGSGGKGGLRAYLPLAALLLLAAGCRDDAPPRPVYGTPPLEVEQALRSFVVAPGFRVEPFAAEPLISDPVAMEVDEAGRIYVVEMPGYPLDVNNTGRVKLLLDTTGDGRPDSATVFADSLVLPTGVMRWKHGILVTDAPHVWYFEDTDGDGRADVRRVVLTGFALSNPQHNFNQPLYGLDGWIYLANNGTIWTETYSDLFGDRGSEIRFPDAPGAPTLPRNANGRNVRFRPDTHQLEMLAGASQFGHSFDPWGRHFLVSNADHVYVEAIGARYLARNPDLVIPYSVDYIPDHGDAAEVFPITRDPEHQLLTDRGVFTSASGVTFYTGGAFGAAYDDVAFVAESVHNLVHADRITPNGASFRASRVFEDREFLASTDGWFRPVQFYVGPDGALYVIDYYRQIVEHPQWMDDAAAASANLLNGNDRGRIWRVVPEGAPRPDWPGRLTLGTAPPAELVRALEHPNLWWRRTAQRLLADRRPPDAVPLLRRLAAEGKRPTARLHALWTLEGLGGLDAELIVRALRDPEPGVRENAVRMAESRLPDERLTAALLAMRDETDPRVRFQLVATLGDVATDASLALRQRLLFENIEDRWMQVAGLSSMAQRDPALFQRTVDRLGNQETEGRARYFRLVSAMIGARRQPEDIGGLVRTVLANGDTAAGWWRAASLEGLAGGLRGRGADALPLAAEREVLLRSLFEQADARVRAASLATLEVVGLPGGRARGDALGRAAALAADRGADPQRRADAFRLLALADPSPYDAALRAAIDPMEPATVQQAAVRTLARIPGEATGRFLLQRWGAMTPEVRNAAVDALMTERGRVRLLLDAIERNEVQTSTVGWERSVVLMRDWDGAERDRARALLADRPGERDAVVERYQAALALRGDPGRGREVFQANCSACHQVSGADGTAFGPDLGTVRRWSSQALLSKILNPGRSIADGYELWLVQRHGGGTVAGVIAAETATTVTLRNAGQPDVTIPRSDIASISASNVSVMPSGFERQIDEQQMADLIAYLRGQR